VLLLGAVGIVMAVGAGRAPADEPTASVPVSAPETAAKPVPAETPATTGSDVSADAPAEVSPAQPVTPPPAPRPAAKPASKPAATPSKKAAATPPKQRYKIGIGGDGYDPSVIRASSASPITLTVGKGDGCAAGFAVPAQGIEMDNSRGPVTFSLGRLKAGTYVYSCSMGMIEGRLVVK
jgi:hypothetical protein